MKGRFGYLDDPESYASWGLVPWWVVDFNRAGQVLNERPGRIATVYGHLATNEIVTRTSLNKEFFHFKFPMKLKEVSFK